MLGSRRISRAPPAQRPISMQPPAIPLPAFPVPSCTYCHTPADISPCPRPRNGVYCFSVRSVCKIYEAHPRCSTRDAATDLQNKNRIRQFGTILSLNKTTGQTAGLQTSPCCDLGWCFFKHRFFYGLPKSMIWHACQTQRFPKSLIWLKPTV